MCSLLSLLPDEILVEIFNKLDFRTKGNVLQVCKRWNIILTGPGCVQPPVNLVVFRNHSLLRKDSLFPKELYTDGENVSNSWDTVYLTCEQASAFLTTFRYGRKINLAVDDDQCAKVCLEAIAKYWKVVDDVWVEHFNCGSGVHILSSSSQEATNLITGLSLTLDICDTNKSEGARFFPCMTRFQVSATGYFLSVNPFCLPLKGIEHYWCPTRMFKLGSRVRDKFGEFLLQHGKSLKRLSCAGLTLENLLQLSSVCPNMEALQLTLDCSESTAEVCKVLVKFKHLKHFGMWNSARNTTQRASRHPGKCIREWPNLESLYIVQDWARSKSVIKLLKACCPKLSALYVLDKSFIEYRSSELLDLDQSLPNGLQLVGFVLSRSTVREVVRLLCSFRNATRFYFQLDGALFKEIVPQVQKALSSLASKAPQKTYYIRWSTFPYATFAQAMNSWNPPSNVFCRSQV